VSGANFTPRLGWQAPYIGTPWRFDGYDQSGLSCWGLACLAWQEQADVCLPSFAADLPESAVFSTERVRAVNQLISGEINIMKPLSTPRPMALTLMRKGQNLTHIGLYAHGGLIVHACEDSGSVVQDRLRDLKHSVEGFYWPSEKLMAAQ